MLSGSEGGTRIDLHEKLILMLRRQFLPRGLYEYVTYRKRLEELLPVVHPVLVLRLGGIYLTASHIHELPYLLHAVSYGLESRGDIVCIVQIEAHPRASVIRRQFGQYVNKHALRVRIRQGNIVLYLHAHDTYLLKKLTYEIHSLCGSVQCKLIPLHEKLLIPTRFCDHSSSSHTHTE